MAKDLTFRISVEMPEPMQVSGVINKQVFPLLNQAVRAVAQATMSQWQQNVYQAKLWSGEKDAYAKSISWKMTGDFTAVVTADYKHAQGIETGRGAYDLKQMLNTSTKVRRTEKGKRFLVIPMRHSVKKLEAAGLYDMAKALSESMVTGDGIRPAGEITHLSPSTGMAPSAKQSPYLSSTATKQAMMVPSKSYNWGDKLGKGEMKAAGVSAENRKWAQNMYRFNTSAGKGQSSEYLSFRMMMEGSTGWVKPAEPGQSIARDTQQQMAPKATLAFQAAIAKQFKQGG